MNIILELVYENGNCIIAFGHNKIEGKYIIDLAIHGLTLSYNMWKTSD